MVGVPSNGWTGSSLPEEASERIDRADFQPVFYSLSHVPAP